ncbi:MAG: hypothetical protein AB3N18_04670, partial [Allomuricauda sp.]
MKNILSAGLVLALFFISDLSSAQELYTDSNAANINNEADSTTGWDGGYATVSSISTESYSGSHSIKIEAPSDGYFFKSFDFATVQDEQYVVTLYAKSSSPTIPGIYWNGITDFQEIPITGNDWTQYTKTVTATGSSIEVSVYTGSPALSGNTVFVDHISITPVGGASDTQAPTAPTISSTGQTETTADLSWSGATDDTGVTGYKIFKDGNLEATLGDVGTYQVTGLIEGTTYSFTATALDAAGNESTASNALSVTTDSTGGSSGGGSSGSVWSQVHSVASYSGDVAIGTTTVPTGYKMALDGNLIAEEITVQVSGSWPDYVFNKDY